MVNSCVICKKGTSKDCGRSIHRMPSGKSKRKLWKDQLHLGNTKLAKEVYVCSDHFSEEDFLYKSGKRFLKTEAIPTRISLSIHCSSSTSPDERPVTPEPLVKNSLGSVRESLKLSYSSEWSSNLVSSEVFTVVHPTTSTSPSKKLSVEQLLEGLSKNQDDTLEDSFSTDTASFSSSRTLTASEIGSESPESSAEQNPNHLSERCRSVAFKRNWYQPTQRRTSSPTSSHLDHLSTESDFVEEIVIQAENPAEVNNFSEVTRDEPNQRKCKNSTEEIKLRNIQDLKGKKDIEEDRVQYRTLRNSRFSRNKSQKDKGIEDGKPEPNHPPPIRTRCSSHEESRHNSSSDEVLDTAIHCVPSKKSKQPQLDGVDHLFLSYAATFKTFRPMTQAKMKLKLASIFAETELSELQGLNK